MQKIYYVLLICLLSYFQSLAQNALVKINQMGDVPDTLLLQAVCITGTSLDTIQEVFTQHNYCIIKMLSIGKAYSLTCSSPQKGFNCQTKTVYLENTSTDEVVDVNFKLEKLDKILEEYLGCTLEDYPCFDRHSTKLNERSKEILLFLVKYLQDYPSHSLKIIGHADTTEQNPEKLSLARAKVVCDYLIQEGISPLRLQAEGQGSKTPIVPNYEDGKLNKNNLTLNRRVEVRAFQGKDYQSYYVINLPTDSLASKVIVYGYRHLPNGKKIYVGTKDFLTYQNKVIFKLPIGFYYSFYHLTAQGEQEWKLYLSKEQQSKTIVVE